MPIDLGPLRRTSSAFSGPVTLTGSAKALAFGRIGSRLVNLKTNTVTTNFYAPDSVEATNALGPAIGVIYGNVGEHSQQLAASEYLPSGGSIVFVGSLTQTASDQDILALTFNGGWAPLKIIYHASSGSIKARSVSSSTYDTAGVIPADGVTRPFVAVATFSPSGSYPIGIYLKKGSAETTAAASDSSRYLVFGDSSANQTNINFAYVTDEIFSPGRAASIAKDPWQLFARQSVKITIPSSGGITTPTLLTATCAPGSLTSTSVRPRVTFTRP